jgi:hypothetical protein
MADKGSMIFFFILRPIKHLREYDKISMQLKTDIQKLQTYITKSKQKL